MTTEELVVLDQQAKETLNEIQKMSNIVISELLKELRPFMSSLYKLCEDVAELDVLLALAQASSIGSYIRPEFNSYLEVRNCVHPLLDYNSQKMPVPNDIFASPEYNFTIITGPNMGGKSIYVKQIAIMQIMAQLGCFLPATNAVLRLCDRIFSRIGFNDSVELNASSFVIEMKETQHILKGLTPTSLVIVDELCRGTSSDEGTSLAWAICEELMQSSAFTFFTTHFLYLTRLQDLYYNVVNRHTLVTEVEGTDNSQSRLVYQHKVELGVTKIENYGLALAAMTNMPEETVNLAKELVELIEEDLTVQSISNKETSEDGILYKLKADIEQLHRKYPNSKNKDKEIISKFKMDNPQLIERIKSQKNGLTKTTESTRELSSESSLCRKHTTSDQMESKINEQKANSTDSTTKKSTTTSSENEYQDKNQTNNSDLPPENFSRDDSTQDNEVVHYTSIKLSTELLNTVPLHSEHDNDNEIYPHNEINTQDDNDIYPHNDSSKTPILKLYDSQLHKRNLSNGETGNAMECDMTDALSNSIDVTLFDDDLDETDSIVCMKDKEDVEITKSVQQNPDVADALTQVIEKCFVSSSSSSENYSILSTDEKLLQETIRDINNDLTNYMTVENIILTPPGDFRDS